MSPSPSVADVLRRIEALEQRVASLAPAAAESTDSAAALTDVLFRLRRMAAEDSPALPPIAGFDRIRDRVLVSAWAGPAGSVMQVTSLGQIVAEEADEGIAGLAEAAAHPIRVRILKLLAAAERSAKEIGETVGLEGGPLYHHLRAMIAAGLIAQPERSRYAVREGGVGLLSCLGGLHRSLRCCEPATTSAVSSASADSEEAPAE